MIVYKLAITNSPFHVLSTLYRLDSTVAAPELPTMDQSCRQGSHCLCAFYCLLWGYSNFVITILSGRMYSVVTRRKHSILTRLSSQICVFLSKKRARVPTALVIFWRC